MSACGAVFSLGWITVSARDAGPLVSLREAALDGTARGVAFALTEALGSLPRRALAPQIAALDNAGRHALAQAGVRLGALSVFMPAMLKPARSRCAGLLWWAWSGAGTPPPMLSSAVSMDRDPAVPDACYAALGLVPLDTQVVRADIAERLAARLRRAARREPFAIDPGMLKLAACKRAKFDDILGALGYTMVGIGTDGLQRFARNSLRPHRPAEKSRRRGREADPDLSLREAQRACHRRRSPVVTRDAPALAVSRLDKWLWYARFFKTRGLAQKACEAGRIRVNGRRVTKAHRTVGPGDVLTFVQGRMVRIVRILEVAERRGSAPEARQLYEEIEQE